MVGRYLATLPGSRGSCMTNREAAQLRGSLSSVLLTHKPSLLRSGKVKSECLLEPILKGLIDAIRRKKPSLRRERQPEVKVGTNRKRLTSINCSSRWCVGRLKEALVNASVLAYPQFEQYPRPRLSWHSKSMAKFIQLLLHPAP
jgi:hypothetical protein